MGVFLSFSVPPFYPPTVFRKFSVCTSQTKGQTGFLMRSYAAWTSPQKFLLKHIHRVKFSIDINKYSLHILQINIDPMTPHLETDRTCSGIGSCTHAIANLTRQSFRVRVSIKKQTITMKNCNFRDVMPRSLVEAYWHLVRIYSLHIYDQRVSTASRALHIRFTKGVKGLKVCDDSTLVQILCFWTLSIVPFIFKNTTFRRLDSVSVFRQNVVFLNINRAVF
jgi:hypothetical protein